MMRTTVYLSTDSKRRLRVAARRRRRSEADLIREAIDHLLADEPARPVPDPPTLDLGVVLKKLLPDAIWLLLEDGPDDGCLFGGSGSEVAACSVEGCVPEEGLDLGDVGPAVPQPGCVGVAEPVGS